MADESGLIRLFLFLIVLKLDKDEFLDSRPGSFFGLHGLTFGNGFL